MSLSNAGWPRSVSDHHFRLFIAKEKKEQPQAGVFSCYGLSPITTVPLF
ncbi:MAG: type I-F CRISPR-associated endoribonuclease Cas6/Csy4 [Deltaproteobacteria bacterium]|nr:type I-F CRISPR-associated endoribonuclease Cas6/Csy4 [Deltaproteobacteria bacterium]